MTIERDLRDQKITVADAIGKLEKLVGEKEDKVEKRGAVKKGK